MSLYAEPTLGPAAVDYCGPHTCQRHLAAGEPAQWYHVLVVGRACPIERVADCLDCRLLAMPRLAPKVAA